MTIHEAMSAAVQCHQAGRVAEAEAFYRQVLAADPRHVDALQYLAILAHQAGRSDIAADLNLQAIALAPWIPELHCNLGTALREQGRLGEAIAAYRQALQLRPDFAVAQNNLGNVLQEHGRLDEASTAFHRAIEIDPGYADPYSNLGNALRDQGRLDDAIAAYRRAIDHRPDFADAHSNLGNALRDIGRLDEAIASCRRAIECNPGHAEAHCNLGVSLKDKGQPDLAIVSYRRAIELKPDYAAAHSNMGVALAELGRTDEAVSAYRRALGIKPGFPDARSNLLLHLHCIPGCDADAIFEEHRKWQEIHARPMGQHIRAHANARDPERRLRIGYVSPDFRSHSVGFFFAGLLAAHDRSQFEIFCYANLAHEDDMTRQLRQHAHVWRGIAGMGDAQVADIIRKDGVDILVDLAGHTSGNRLLVFACKPAPIQITWLGYPDTTGLDTMDFRMTDAHADPPGLTERHHSERLIRLDPCAWCFQPPASPPIAVRADGPITFGCFNHFSKVTAPMLTIWARVLHAVPGSRLLLKAGALGSGEARGRVLRSFGASGIAAERIELRTPEADHAQHLALYDRLDIALDTFPYHGTTTTCEALWMGTPVVTLAGKTHASRVGVSLLSNVGLHDLVADSEEQFIALAAALANDPPRLAALRASLRERMKASPLMDAAGFAKNVEAEYRRMWREWCALWSARD